MSLFNSVLGSISPRLRDSFEDPHAPDYELSSYRSSSVPRVPPPVASTVLWSAPQTKLSPPPQVPDDLLAIQRKARHLEKQLQELLDAQADGLIGSLSSKETIPDDLVSNGSTTPTVSSMRGGTDRSSENEDYTQAPKKKVGLNTARKRIARRIQQLASVKAEELDVLEENLRDLDSIVKKTSLWTQKRTRLSNKISSMTNDTTASNTQTLRTQASTLEQEIRQKEEELQVLKTRHRRILNELADTENSIEAKSSSYKASLSYLDKEINTFLARPPVTKHVPLSTSPFLTLPPHRRTLEMAHDYWQEEQMRLAERCEEIDIDRAALDEGAVLWNEVVQRIVDFETSLQKQMTQPRTSSFHSNKKAAAASTPSDLDKLLERMDTTVSYLEDTLELASQRGWNLLVCAIGAELEAFKQGQALLEQTFGNRRKGKASVRETTTEDEGHENYTIPFENEDEEQMSRSAFRIRPSTSKSPPPPSAATSVTNPKFKSAPKKLFDTDDENDDPDPELLISHE
ncbi:hypothetical protein DM02DRAFT_605780 [Periconia macrospinosa]|uniref:Atg28p n=1 Tax=Periconia macrospinosa TaxID=97972 RepID=A0A2V1D270_9PLEO|nr:hypothetical protein DM02DRAFT_605780 [Periconia macrospinosa]